MWNCLFYVIVLKKNAVSFSLILRSNKYQVETPPLPSRTQFLTAGKTNPSFFFFKPHVFYSLFTPHCNNGRTQNLITCHPIYHLTITHCLICGTTCICLDIPNHWWQLNYYKGLWKYFLFSVGFFLQTPATRLRSQTQPQILHNWTSLRKMCRRSTVKPFKV